jgi:hypothetical protein
VNCDFINPKNTAVSDYIEKSVGNETYFVPSAQFFFPGLNEKQVNQLAEKWGFLVKVRFCQKVLMFLS